MAAALTGLRLPHQNDLLIQLQWSDQFLAALREGWLLPRCSAAWSIFFGPKTLSPPLGPARRLLRDVLPDAGLPVRGPQWKQYLADGKLDGECRRLGLRCGAPVRNTHALSVEVESPRAVAMRLPMFAFPAWGLSVDGQPQALAADPDTGLAVAQLAPGRHLVALRWAGLPAEALGRRISLASLALLLVLLGVSYVRRLRGAQPVTLEDLAPTS